MSEQQFQGTLASGGTFIASSRGIRILDPAGNQLADFDREVISGVGREGQVVTVERHNDTIVTLTAASITDAVGLEQYVRDTFVTPPAPAPQPEPPAVEEESPPDLAFDAFDDDEEPPEPPPPPPPPSTTPEPERPQIISRPDPEDEAERERTRHELPQPVPTTPPPPVPPDESRTVPPDPEEPEPLPGRPQAPVPPPPAASPAPPQPPTAAGPGEEQGGRRLWLWGCLGCGGLLILTAICIGILLAAGAFDIDEFTEEDATSTPFVIIATSDDADPTATEEAGADEPTATEEAGDGVEATAEPSADGVMSVGESGTSNGVVVTLLGSRTDDGGIFPPDEGNEYLILEFQFENTTSEPFPLSTLLQFELTDEAGEEFGIALFAETEAGLDTEIPAGDTITGEVAFEVPEDDGPYTVAYEDLLGDDPLVWQVNP